MTPTTFIVTVSAHDQPPATDPRRALGVDDARRVALDEVETARAYYPGLYIEPDWHRMADATQRIGEYGAIIGPLPDGTIIDIKPAVRQGGMTFERSL